MYQVEEFPEVWADACIRDSDGRFLLLSLYGRDGSLMQLMAAMELGGKPNGIQRFHLLAGDGTRHMTEIGGTDRLAKQSTRLPKQNLFGPLSQMWLFDKQLQEPDRANRIGWALHRHATADPRPQDEQLCDQAWQLIKSMSPVALLEHWRGAILKWCDEKRATQMMGSELYPVLGQVYAMRVSLSDHFVAFISEEVKAGRLRLTP